MSNLKTPPNALIGLEGKKFNSLTVIRRIFVKKWSVTYRCQCDCGRFTLTQASNLIRERSKTCGICVKEKYKLDPSLAMAKRLYATYRLGARKRNLEFTISFEEFVKLTRNICYYCGSTASNLAKSEINPEANYIYNGIDRVDNNRGYIFDNCVSCCKFCNYAKTDMHITKFVLYLEQLKNFTGGLWKDPYQYYV